jgi:hypothetical protein
MVGATALSHAISVYVRTLDKWILFPQARRVPSRLRNNGGVTASQIFNATSLERSVLRPMLS